MDTTQQESNWSSVDGFRAQSVWLLGHVCYLIWGFFCIFLLANGYVESGIVCAVELLVYTALFLTFRKSDDYLHIMNLILTCSAIGLLAVACSHPKLNLTFFFIPISILISSMLFGFRQAFCWLVISLATILVCFLTIHGIQETWNTKIVELILAFGVPVCIFLCCQQAESFFQQKFDRMIEFSKTLQRRSERLSILATTDSLTKLPNRYQFKIHLDECVKNAKNGQPFVLFLIDMDGFKEINDTMGHAVGDEVLVEIGRRLEQNFSSMAMVARLGGDEFCVLVEDISHQAAAEAFANRLVDVLTKRYFLGENEFTLGTSVGFAICPQHSDTSKHILAYADTAMYHAKHHQLPVACYRRQMTRQLLENREMNEQLANAIERNEFYLVYQPQFEITTGEMVGVEALLRWKNRGRLVPVSQFIGLLEKSGQILHVSNWIIRTACRQLAEWRTAGLELKVAINISAVQFEDPAFFENIIDPIREFQIAPQNIELEITEGLLIHNVSNVVKKLQQLKAFGLSISIDDFGTGYSSLAYLRQFPIDRLKIDRVFVKDIPDADDGLIASSIIVLGQALGLKVLAEGVETQEQLNVLKQHGCEECQGFLFSRPCSPEQILQLAGQRLGGHVG